MDNIRSYGFVAGIIAAAMLYGASSASAQHVGSVYMDAVGDGSTLWAVVSSSDGSGDCEHENFNTLAWLDGPTGFSGTWQSGFYNSVSVPFADGDFTEGGALSWSCGCWGNFQTPDATQGLSISTTWYDHTDTEPKACIYGLLACTSGTPTCARPTIVTGAPQPCAPYRKVRYVKIVGVCNDVFSTGSTATTRVCT